MRGRKTGDHRTFAYRRLPGRVLRDTLTAYAFISPSAVIIGVFGLFPVFFTLYVSLFRWRLARGPFSGLGNYITLFGGNPFFLAAFLTSVAGLVLSFVLFRAGRESGSRAAAVGGAALLVVSLFGIAVCLPSVVSRGDREVFDALRVTVWYCLLTVPP